MSTLRLKDTDWDLIADEVLDALDADDAAALDAVDSAQHARAREELEHTAGALAAALAQSRGPAAMPAAVAERLTARCQRMTVAAAPAPRATAARPEADRAGTARAAGPSVIARIGPWAIAAAACLVAAISVWPTSASSPREQLALLRERVPDTRVASWGDWALEGQPPKVAGVAGEIVWSDEKQAGVMRFDGLPPCQAGQRYQLWIVDAQRGFEQRISGAIFDGGPGEVYVPVKPEIPVHEAAAFAVTIEEEAGTWVSDMSRRVVIAMVK